MPFILVANQKGGVGKTTTSLNLLEHLPVNFIIDADQHQGISGLLKATNRTNIECVCPESESDMKAILKLRSTIDEWTLIDAGGFDSNLTRQCIVYASRFGCIVTPSSDDIVDQMGLIEFNQTLENLEDLIGIDVFSYVIPMRIHHSRKHTALDLSSLKNLKLASLIIPESAQIKKAAIYGRGVRNGNVAFKFEKLAKFIIEICNYDKSKHG